MKNTNCLAGLQCPACGHDDEVVVRASMWVSVTDDGTDPFADSTDNMGGTEYDRGSDAKCPSCGHEGKLKEWEVKA